MVRWVVWLWLATRRSRGDEGGLLSRRLDRRRLESSCAPSGAAAAPYYARRVAAGRESFESVSTVHRASDGAAPRPRDRFVLLWGKFGLLNNRVRCLANALAWAGRVNATVVLSGTWELFTAAVLDEEWLVASSPADVAIIKGGDWKDVGLGDETVQLACNEAFACGGPCDRAAAHVQEAWGLAKADWVSQRAGGQDPRTAGRLFDDGALCGYAALAPRAQVRNATRNWLLKQTAPLQQQLKSSNRRAGAEQHRPVSSSLLSYTAYHQRLETTNVMEPVSKMCVAAAKRLAATYHASSPGDDHPDKARRSFYDHVCDGTVSAAALRAAATAPDRPIFLASDRFNEALFEPWRHARGVFGRWDESAPDDLVTTTEGGDERRRGWRGPSRMFDTTLGNALYAPSFHGGPNARRAALGRAVEPVLVDMLLLVQAAEFWPTPGSTMSQTVCYWRKAWTRGAAPVPALRACDEIVLVPP